MIFHNGYRCKGNVCILRQIRLDNVTAGAAFRKLLGLSCIILSFLPLPSQG